MASHYKQFLRLVQHWPADSSKGSRDLGQHIKEEVKRAFASGVLSTADEQKCSKTLSCLTRLCNNYYGLKYKRRLSSSSSGLTYEQCHKVLSKEFLDELQSEKGLFSFFKRK